MPRKSGKAGAPPIAKLPQDGVVVDPLDLVHDGPALRCRCRDLVAGRVDLLRQEPCWVPAEIVHTDYTQPLDGYFLAGSNGLASGNHLVEAISSAICELVERDAVAVWSASGIRATGATGSRHRLCRRPGLPSACWPSTTRPASRSGYGTSRRISAFPPSFAISATCPRASHAGCAISTAPAVIPIGRSL